jgi:hypothetical protein
MDRIVPLSSLPPTESTETTLRRCAISMMPLWCLYGDSMTSVLTLGLRGASAKGRPTPFFFISVSRTCPTPFFFISVSGTYTGVPRRRAGGGRARSWATRATPCAAPTSDNVGYVRLPYPRAPREPIAPGIIVIPGAVRALRSPCTRCPIAYLPQPLSERDALMCSSSCPSLVLIRAEADEHSLGADEITVGLLWSGHGVNDIVNPNRLRGFAYTKTRRGVQPGLRGQLAPKPPLCCGSLGCGLSAFASTGLWPTPQGPCPAA